MMNPAPETLARYHSAGGAPDCPVSADLQQAESLALDLRRTMRRLRRDLRKCPQCPQQAGCKVLETVNDHLNAALTAVGVEWEQAGPDFA